VTRRMLLTLATLAACQHPAGNQPPPAQVDAPAQVTDAHEADGPSTASGDPADDGSATVTMQDVSIPGATTGRTLPSTIYTPSGVGPFPLVVISPGFQMARTQYASYAHHLATWGFVAVLTDYADQGLFADHQLLANDIPAVIDYAIANATIDTAKIALAGHSLGGDISVLAATGEPRVTAVVGWDPVDGSPSVVPEKMSMFTAALAVVGETTDGSGGFMPCSPTADNYAQFYMYATSPAVSMTLVGADHMDWVDDGTCALCTLCTAGTASPDLAHTTTRRLNVAWLRSRFYSDASMASWLTNPPEVAAGTATVTQK
jgi:acetyl esterase/lipase